MTEDEITEDDKLFFELCGRPTEGDKEIIKSLIVWVIMLVLLACVGVIFNWLFLLSRLV